MRIECDDCGAGDTVAGEYKGDPVIRCAECERVLYRDTSGGRVACEECHRIHGHAPPCPRGEEEPSRVLLAVGYVVAVIKRVIGR